MNDPLLEEFKSNLKENEFSYRTTHRAPSNIALVKYWGKYDPQIPANPSISFTLSKAFTDTTVSFEPSNSPEINLNFLVRPSQVLFQKFNLLSIEQRFIALI